MPPIEGADGVAGPVEREDAGPRLDRVVVGQQRVVRRLDDGLADLRPREQNAEHQMLTRQADERREAGEDHAAEQREADPVVAVGERGDRHGQGEGGGEREDERDDDARHADAEVVGDVGAATANEMRASSSTALSPNRMSSARPARRR